jgi:choline dehydrogenase-like flavoprotein
MVVNERFRVRNTTNLYISDASILTEVAAGGTSTLVMEQGMRVADAVHADFNDHDDTQKLDF